MKNIDPKEVQLFWEIDNSDVSTSEDFLNEDLTEQQKAIAWSEFEYEMYLLNKEDNY